MVIGGSQGASAVNQSIRDALPKLLQQFYVVHLCGKDKMDNLLLTKEGYKQFEYVTDGLADMFAMADIVVSRAGANAIFELLTLRKPNILIPLPGGRGDQILNADSFEKQGYSMVLQEENLDAGALTDAVHELFFTKQTFIENMEGSPQYRSIEIIMELIEEVCNEER
jgi:UDP-N-acetylglucosamine--N-acetylmuramyl-(pentapeptide) pyrophosphoryl-undecaprenol N-acetylglucosamine transferase